MARAEYFLGLAVDLSWPCESLRSPEGARRHTESCRHFLQECVRLQVRGLTLNINAWLVLAWSQGLLGELGFDCLEALRSSLRYGLVELTGCAAHHPILPLLHPFESRRQMVINSVIHERLLLSGWAPAGFFPPELAFGHELPGLLETLRFKWCLSDDAAFASLHGFVPTQKVPCVGQVGVLLASRLWSDNLGNSFSDGKDMATATSRFARETEQWFRQSANQADSAGSSRYLVLAFPRQRLSTAFTASVVDFVKRIATHGDWSVVHLSKILDRFPLETMEIPPGSWKMSTDEFWRGEFYSHWKSSESRRHQIQWRIAELAWSSLEGLREKLDLGMSSRNFEGPGGDEDGMRALVDVVAAGRPDQLETLRELLQALGQ